MYIPNIQWIEKPGCDLCGNLPNQNTTIYKVEESICLCPDCTSHFEAMPPKLGECVERFLLGNVM